MVQQMGIVPVGTHWPAPPFPYSGTYGHGARGAAAVGSAPLLGSEVNFLNSERM